MAVQCIQLPNAAMVGAVSSSVSTLQDITTDLRKDIRKLENDIKGLERVHKKSNWQKAVRCGRR